MILTFDWDQWNIQKNEAKHGVSKLEVESVFYDTQLLIYDDLKHSNDQETRYICYGLGIRNRTLMIAFTIRFKKVRIISARPASKKERKIYEEQKTKRD